MKQITNSGYAPRLYFFNLIKFFLPWYNLLYFLNKVFMYVCQIIRNICLYIIFNDTYDGICDTNFSFNFRKLFNTFFLILRMFLNNVFYIQNSKHFFYLSVYFSADCNKFIRNGVKHVLFFILKKTFGGLKKSLKLYRVFSLLFLSK